MQIKCIAAGRGIFGLKALPQLFSSFKLVDLDTSDNSPPKGMSVSNKTMVVQPELGLLLVCTCALHSATQLENAGLPTVLV